MTKLLATTGLLAVIGTAALAQYQGPVDQEQTTGSYDRTTVSAIKADPKDEAKVTLEGRLNRKTGDETYMFSDTTGEILVEIDDDDFPSQPVSEKTVVRIEGEVDTHLLKDVDVDVDRMTVVQ